MVGAEQMLMSLTLLAAGAHQQPPLLDIDWTALVQLGAFLVLLAVLQLLVFGPYLRARREQTARVDGFRDTAQGLHQQLDQRLADYEARIADTRRDASTKGARLRATEEAKAQSRLAHARATAEDEIEQARRELATRVPAVALALRMRADELGRVIATKALGRQL